MKIYKMLSSICGYTAIKNKKYPIVSIDGMQQRRNKLRSKWGEYWIYCIFALFNDDLAFFAFWSDFQANIIIQ